MTCNLNIREEVVPRDRLPSGNLIPRRIMDDIESGERDPVRLKAYALRVFRKPE